MLKYSSFALAGLVLHLMLGLPLTISAQSNSDPQLIQRVKADVAVIGVGARVSIKLREKKKITGYISRIGENDFIITKAKEGPEQTIAYTDVTQIKQNKERHFSTEGKILIIVVGVLWITGLIANGGG